jgi:hypothetical protein
MLVMSEQTTNSPTIVISNENTSTSTSVTKPSEENHEKKHPSPPTGPRKLPPLPSHRPSLPNLRYSVQSNSKTNENHCDTPKAMMEKLNESSDVEVASKLKILLTNQSSSPSQPKKVPPPLPKRPMLKPLPKIPPKTPATLNPSPRTPKVTAKGPLPKRPTHLPPPPPKPQQVSPSLPPVPENQPSTTSLNLPPTALSQNGKPFSLLYTKKQERYLFVSWTLFEMFFVFDQRTSTKSRRKELNQRKQNVVQILTIVTVVCNRQYRPVQYFIPRLMILG